MLFASTLLHFCLFLLLFLFSFYPFGYFVIKKIKLDLVAWEYITLAFCFSVNFFVLLAFLLGVLNLRFLMLPVIALVNGISIYFLRKQLFTEWTTFLKNKFLVALVFLGILVQGFINFPSGYLYKEGFLYWSSQGNDGLWHVAVMEEIKKTLPAQSPIFAGEKLYNYHYLVDVLMGEFGRIYPFFSSQDLYFRFFPVIFSFFIGLSVFAFLYRYSKKIQIAYLGIFFTYLAGSFGYIFTYIKNGQIFGGETVFWASQGNTILGNPPHAISYFIFLSTLLAISIYISNRSKYIFLLAFFLGSVLVGYKVSAGIVLLAGIGVAGGLELLIKRKTGLFFMALFLIATNFLFLLSISKGVGSFLIFEPWWFIRTTIVERMGWIDLELRRQHYLSKGTWNAYLRVLQIESTAFLIFLFGNLGTRFIGFIDIFKKLKKYKFAIFMNPLEILLLTSMITGFIIPLLFLQKGIAYNSIQFIQYFILIFGFYSASAFYFLYSKIKALPIRLLVLVVLITFSVPTVIGNFVEFYSRPALAKVNNFEVQALEYLKNNTPRNTVILTTTFNKDARYGAGGQPWPISVWYSTAYVSALSGRRTYLSNEDQVDILGYHVRVRRDDVNKFFNGDDINWNRDFLTRSKISYIYAINSELKKDLNLKGNGLVKIFNNEEVSIYKYEN